MYTFLPRASSTHSGAPCFEYTFRRAMLWVHKDAVAWALGPLRGCSLLWTRRRHPSGSVRARPPAVGMGNAGFGFYSFISPPYWPFHIHGYLPVVSNQRMTTQPLAPDI